MTKQNVDTFEKLQSQLDGLYQEISSLSKKSQNDLLNKFKLKFINQILSDANRLLTDRYKPFKDFDIFDEAELPTNSDGALILTQYLNCFEKYRSDNIMRKENSPSWFWIIDGKLSNVKTTMPTIIKEK